MLAVVAIARAVQRERKAWLGWGSRSAFATIDQGLFAGSNYLVTVLLARWLPAEDYGRFTIVYSIFLLIGTFHTTALTAPMLILGAGKYVAQFQRYLRFLLFAHGVLTGTISLLLMLTAWVCWQAGAPHVGQALLGVAFAAPCILFLWFVRAVFYVSFQPQGAAAGGVLYLVLLAFGTHGLYRMHYLTTTSVLILMGGTSLIVASMLLSVARPHERVGLAVTGGGIPQSPPAERSNAPLPTGHAPETCGVAPRQVIRDHFTYAKWAMAADATAWVGGNLHYLVLSALTGLQSVAVMRVLDTMLLPYGHCQAAINRLVLPALGARSRTPRARLFPVVARVGAVLVSGAAVAYLLIRALSPDLIRALYGGKYTPYAYLLAWYALILIPESVIEVGYTLFRATLRPKLVFSYQVVFVLSSVIGYLTASPHGLQGILTARIAISYALSLPLIASVRAVCEASRRAGVQAYP